MEQKSDACISQEMPSNAGNSQELGERHGTDPSLDASGVWSYRHFDLGLPASRTVREYISLF